MHPVTSHSIEDGAVLIDAGGRIAAVGPNAQVPSPRDTTALHFPDAELIPGLINCHTHLELTNLGGDGAGQHHEPDFSKWIRRIRELKEATAPEAFHAAAVAGVRDSWAHGVTCIAETGSTGTVMRALHDLGGRGIVYQEVFGPDPARAALSMAELETAIQHLRWMVSPRLRLGVSPHAPYTVSAPLYDAVAGFARREDLPIAVHVAESREESALIRDGEGPFADALRARGIDVTPWHMSPVAYLVKRGVLKRGSLCIHCVQVDDVDIELIRACQATVAHCPLSNRAHGHGVAPVRAFRRSGVRVGLGTDSVVSVGALNLWAEAEAAGYVGEAAIRALTLDNARALDWDSDIGSLEVGKSADLAVLSPTVPYRPLPSSTVVLTVVSGRIVHQISGQ